MRVCIDTHVLIWGIQRKANSTQLNKIQKTEKFIQWLEENRHEVAIPAPVLAEFLTGLPPDKADEIQKIFTGKFIVLPFDIAAARKYAEIYQKHNKTILNTRYEVKADCMIIAVAVTTNCDCIYSEDEGLKKIAQGFIEVRPVPVIPHQPQFV